MGRFKVALSMLSCVVLRKCMQVYHEYAYLFVDMAFILVTWIRFSGVVFRQSAAVSGRYSPMSSMITRQDH
ncbi:hypothetical protein L6164_002453 [Bauhinia variegata]|uniref:Uncharacterized protein n=1 Tax=Bauhinia variegata TaxID=167791 RepID=A0ACB9PYE0_BAUVA|nr:hypothetical protein L6164_002453 [Bauhinia variegata]